MRNILFLIAAFVISTTSFALAADLGNGDQQSVGKPNSITDVFSDPCDPRIDYSGKAERCKTPFPEPSLNQNVRPSTNYDYDKNEYEPTAVYIAPAKHADDLKMCEDMAADKSYTFNVARGKKGFTVSCAFDK